MRLALPQAVQKAAGAVSNAQKTLQSGGQIQATPTPTPSAPPALNINIPGLGGNQAPAGVTYTPGSNQYAQGSNQYAQGGNQYAQGGNQYTQGGNQYGQVSISLTVALPAACHASGTDFGTSPDLPP